MSMPNGEEGRMPMSLEDVVASLGQQVGALSVQLSMRDSIIGHLQAERAELKARIPRADRPSDNEPAPRAQPPGALDGD